MLKPNPHKIISLLFLLFLVLPNFAMAATLSFSPDAGTVGPGNTFAVDILLDVTDCVNVIEADVNFPKDYMQLRDFIVGESILAIWVKQPSKNDLASANKTGILNFIGGIPGGYCGKIPGDLGNSNTVARLVFEIPSSLAIDTEKTKLDISFLSSTKALLNDGLGTQDNLTTKGASFALSTEKVNIDESWSEQLSKDNIAPEPFIVELVQNKGMFDNKYYIIFSTTDKQSGIDHFEVLEIRKDQEEGVVKEVNWFQKLLGKKQSTANWKIAQIPYLLEDQELLSIIRVKAIDKAGNERFVEYIPPEANQNIDKNISSSQWMIFVGIALLVLIIIGLLVIFIKKIILKKRYDKEQDN